MMSRTRAPIKTSSQARASLRATVGAALACATAVFATTASAVPVIPQAGGYGIETPAGRGGAVLRVTNLNASGPGSLRACVDATGPRVCVFEVSGTIRVTENVVIRNSNITIAGQTAPSPGITVLGAGLHVYGASDVLVQHLRFRPGDAADGPPPDNRDALMVSHSTKSFRNVVIDHCSFSWSIDEVASVYAGWDNVTLSDNIFANPLNDSLHPKGPHGYGLLVEADGHTSIIGNLFANNERRNPLAKATHVVLANNVVYNAAKGVVQLEGSDDRSYVMMHTMVGNVFLRGPDSGNAEPIEIRPSQAVDGLASGSKIYLADNVAPGVTSDPWSITGVYKSTLDPFQATQGDVLKFRSEAVPVWPANMTRLPASDNVVLNHVLKFAGARPADRDSVDRGIVDGVKSRTGRVINCVAPNGTARCQLNAGGWPTLASNQRALTLPANPNEVTASGYTNLELWLHKMSAAVEGRTAMGPVPPRVAGH